MEKGPITYAEYWASEYAEVNHFYSHGYNMGYTYIIYHGIVTNCYKFCKFK